MTLKHAPDTRDVFEGIDVLSVILQWRTRSAFRVRSVRSVSVYLHVKASCKSCISYEEVEKYGKHGSHFSLVFYDLDKPVT
jgi:hypothetical protein